MHDERERTDVHVLLFYDLWSHKSFHLLLICIRRNSPKRKQFRYIIFLFFGAEIIVTVMVNAGLNLKLMNAMSC